MTFNDLYIFREEKDASTYTSFANTITHELSHHWFGNLVTMKWWNDLWLNESFADFISHYILSKMNVKSKPLIDIWVEFNMRKSWGYSFISLSNPQTLSLFQQISNRLIDNNSSNLLCCRKHWNSELYFWRNFLFKGQCNSPLISLVDGREAI